MRIIIRTALIWLVLGLGPALGAEWRWYSDPDLDFSIELPVDGFSVDPGIDDRLTLVGEDGETQIEVFGVRNAEGLSRREFAALVESADPEREVTYRADGRTWVVISGYLDASRDMIFYAKFMFSPDGSSLSAFEISYPRDKKRQLDALVTRLEKSLTSPRADS